MSQLTWKPPRQIQSLIERADLLPVAELLKLPAKERIKHVAIGMSLETIGALYAGCALRSLRDELEYGKFQTTYEDIGLSARQAQRYLSLVDLFERLDTKRAAALAEVGYRKCLAIAQWEDDQVAALCEGQPVYDLTINEAKKLSAREFEQRMRESEDYIVHRVAARLKKDLADSEKKRQNLVNELEKERADRQHQQPEWPLPVGRAREEGMTIGLQAKFIADALRNEVAEFDRAISNDAVDETGQKIGFSSIYTAARHAAHQFADIAKSIADYYPDIAGEEHVQPLTSTELKRVNFNLAFFTETFQNNAADRDVDRKNNRAGRKGRKLKK